MDPFSLTVGILAILGAGGKAAKGIQRLRTIKEGPDVLFALRNEVTDVHLVVTECHELLQRAGEKLHIKAPAGMIKALEDVELKLLDLESFIAYKLTTPTSNSEAPFRLDRSVFLRNQSRIQGFKGDLLASRVRLTLSLGQLNKFSRLPNLTTNISLTSC